MKTQQSAFLTKKKNADKTKGSRSNKSNIVLKNAITKKTEQHNPETHNLLKQNTAA